VLRQAEIVAALSLATDLGTGQPLERALRTCLLAFRLGEQLGLTADELRTVYYVALLRFVGCTADAQHLADIFGDELVAQARVSTVELLPIPMLITILRYAGQGYPLSERLQRITYGLTNGIARTREAEVAHCEVSQNIARRLSLSDEVGLALGQIYERWDGRGMPAALKGEALSKAIRLVHIAQDAEVFCRIDDMDTAVNIVRKRSGGFYDPAMVACFVQHSVRLLTELNSDSIWDTVLQIEPAPQSCLNETQIDTAMRAIADFIDLRSVYLHGHSTAVGELAFNAASRSGLSGEDAITLRRAGYVHDLGRVAISLTIWDKPGKLNNAEVDRVRLYPYYTERILARSLYLAPLGTLAALHRERLDGSGYHRGLPAPLLSASARILAAADVYRSKVEPRAYRAMITPQVAADELLEQARDGKLDKQAVVAVLESATGKRTHRRAVRVANLSDREVEVLQLLARGLPTRQIADHLTISPKTADHHIQHIYNKIGVSTRAAAIFFALQNNLLDELSPESSSLPK
jgi:HD-GYP domain-containing protein (c-di-GMP phosphodiesterase class II)